MRDWNRSNSAMAEISGSPISSAWTRTPWPRADANWRNMTWTLNGSAKRVADENRRKKNAGSHFPDRRVDEARHGGRPHDRNKMEPAHDAEDRRTTRHARNRCQQKYGGPFTETDGLQTPCQPQADCNQQKPLPQC